MPRFSRSFGLLAAASLALALCAPSKAKACGGGSFYGVSSSQTVATTGHRVVISLSKTQTVLWDQIEFSGEPKDFVWVYPIKPGATLELANDAWTEALDAGTTRLIQSPTVECEDLGGSGNYSENSYNSGCSCAPGGGSRSGSGDFYGGGSGGGSLGDNGPSVDVVHKETIGPYDTVTISSQTPGAIGDWLTKNGYNIPADAEPILDSYAQDGFDFIALRLKPDAGVSQMKPVRVITPGPTTTFPMRMLAVGAGEKVALNVFVLSEGRVQVDGFANVEVNPDDLVWDFDSDSSNYTDLRDKALQTNDGAAFLTGYAEQGGLFEGKDFSDGTIPSTANTYYRQLAHNGEVPDEESPDCPYNQGAPDFSLPDNEVMGGYTVVNVCDADGICGKPGMNEIDSRKFECKDAKDLGVALIGMHPKDVWVTRLEANLPKAALTKDLVLVPVQGVKEVTGHVETPDYVGHPCASAVLMERGSRPKSPLPPETLTLLGAGAALAFAVARRLSSSRAAVRARA